MRLYNAVKPDSLFSQSWSPYLCERPFRNLITLLVAELLDVAPPSLWPIVSEVAKWFCWWIIICVFLFGAVLSITAGSGCVCWRRSAASVAAGGNLTSTWHEDVLETCKHGREGASEGVSNSAEVTNSFNSTMHPWGGGGGPGGLQEAHTQQARGERGQADAVRAGPLNCTNVFGRVHTEQFCSRLLRAWGHSAVGSVHYITSFALPVAVN